MNKTTQAHFFSEIKTKFSTDDVCRDHLFPTVIYAPSVEVADTMP